MVIKKIREFEFVDWLKNNKFQIFVILLITIIAYASTFDNEFLSDDTRAISENPQLDHFSYVTDRFPHLVRPVLYYTINQIFGRNPAPYHLANTLFHLGTIFCLYLIVYFLHNQQTAFFASLLAGIHPILTEAVTWISGGHYVTYSFFVVSAFVFFLLSFKKSYFQYISILLFTIGLSASAKSMVFPFIITAFLIFWPGLKIKFNWKKIIIPWLIGLVAIGYTALKIPKRLESLKVNYYQNPTMLNPLKQVPSAVTKYLELIIWPKGLTLYHSEISLINNQEFITRAVFFGVFSTLIIYTFFKNKKLFFWFTFSALSLAPMLTPFGVSWLVADRYAYLPALGLFVIFGWLVNKLNQKPKIENIPLAVFLCIIVPLLTLRTIVRNNVWQNQDRLWLSAAKYSPHSAQNQNNLGDLYGRHGNFEKSIFHFKKAIEIRPRYADAYHNMANIYWRIKQPEIALQHYQKAAELNPNIWQTHQNLGILYFQKGETEKALDHMTKAVSINSNSSSLYANLAKMYARLGEEEKAKEAAAKSQQLSAP
jgi:tetratricopeptide (TPR) repeat protein